MDSLKSVINLAKASVIYPPNGLHTMLLGESGVGKSLFAELMYQYGVMDGRFKKSSNFIVFNCADYANNSNLLLSQLFGSIKGSYTGSESDKPGLIEKADGGVLFLDEVHRLPPEGQEMLFLFMDKKKFRRLGEINNNKTANVLIIAATTENPNSMLLTTFMRRIPMTIKIPSLKERSMKEKIKIVTHFYENEAKNINRTIVIDKNVISYLITYNPQGNIGQLRSDIQLSVARGYLDSKISNSDKVKLTKECLPYYTTTGLLKLNKELRIKIGLLLNKDEYELHPKEISPIVTAQPKYDFINYYTNKLKKSRDSVVDIKKIFKEYTQIIAKNLALDKNYLLFIDDDIKEIVSALSDILFDELNLITDKVSYVALAMYLKNLKENTCENVTFNKFYENSKIENDVYKTAQNLVRVLEKNFHIYCPASEISTLAVIISSLKNKETFDAVSIMVISHGNSLATNIANVVNELLGINHVMALDMPLNQKPEEFINIASDFINSKNTSKDILMFVDMGSLTDIEPILKQKTNVNIITVESNNTLLILEATRKAIFLKKDINEILTDLITITKKMNRNFERKIENYLAINKKKVIYTVCITGEGVAFYLEKIINDILKESNIYDVEVIALSGLDKIRLRKRILETSTEKEVLTIVGSVHPVIEDIEFISLEDILLNNGLNKLLTILDINENYNNKISLTKFNKSIIFETACESVNKYLIYLSAEKISPEIAEFINKVENTLKTNFSNSTLVKLFIHMACMIERLLFKGEQLSTNLDLNKYNENNKLIYNTINDSIKNIEKSFNIKIKKNEIYYLIEIVKEDTECSHTS